MKLLNFYVGMANAITFTLMYQGVDDPELIIVPDNTITRAMLQWGDAYCLDTDVVGDADRFYFTDNNTKLVIKGGLTPGLLVDQYQGYLTLFDAVAVDGIAWQDFKIEALDWTKCP